MISSTAQVHAQALVDDDVTVGAFTRIWQFASVIRAAELGADCVVGACANIDGSRLGDRCLVGHGASLHPGIEIGDDAFIGPGAVLCNDRWPSADKGGFRCDLLRRGFVTVRICDGAAIGANAVVLPGVTIGKRATVAAGAVVHCDVPADYLFARDGRLVRIKAEWRERRMREARAC